MALSRVLVSREQDTLRQHTDAEANHVAAQLRAGLLQAMGVLPQVGEWWLSQGRPLAPEDWETDAKLFLQSSAGLREMIWINPAGTPLWSVRPGTAPQPGNYAADSDLLNASRQARATGSLALSPVSIRGGIPSFYACIPIRPNRLAGLVAARFDASVLAEWILKEQLPSEYALSIVADGQSITQMNPPKALWPEGAANVNIDMADRRWRVRLIPAAADIETLQDLMRSFGTVASVLLFLCTSLALIYRRNEATLAAEVQERRRAEETISRLNQSLENKVADFQTLLEVLPVGIAVSNDPECREIWVNRQLAAMLGVSVGENISRSAPNARRLPFTHLRHGIEVPAEELPMQVAARTRKNVIDLELDLVRADGTVLNTLSYSAPVFDQQGELRRVINVCVDVTERKRSEQERKRLQEVLLKAEKYRSLALMAGGLAHDFNNLLTAMIGHAELACRDIPPASPAGHEVAAALAAANRAAELIAQLLAYTGRGWFEQKRLDLSMEIRHVAEGIRAMAPAGVHIEFELAEGLPPVYGGEREVQQVLRNLVLNAIEAIGEGSGDISVRTRLCEFAEEELARDFPGQELIPGTYVALEVTDSGHGASSEVVARVFEPFFTTKFIGRGLGLSAVEGIMRAHGGGVHFDALSERGVRVQVIFPAPHDAGPGSESRVYPLTPLVNPEPAHRLST